MGCEASYLSFIGSFFCTWKHLTLKVPVAAHRDRWSRYVASVDILSFAYMCWNVKGGEYRSKTPSKLIFSICSCKQNLNRCHLLSGIAVCVNGEVLDTCYIQG